MGVKEFRKPATELSILVSATQNKNAGIRLPRSVEIIMIPIFWEGIFLICRMADGIMMIPGQSIRIAATWYGVSAFMPCFIKTNELPQIMESATKRSQFTNFTLLFPIRKFAQMSVLNSKRYNLILTTACNFLLTAQKCFKQKSNKWER
jgi:hypothetical protein